MKISIVLGVVLVLVSLIHFSDGAVKCFVCGGYKHNQAGEPTNSKIEKFDGKDWSDDGETVSGNKAAYDACKKPTVIEDKTDPRKNNFVTCPPDEFCMSEYTTFSGKGYKSDPSNPLKVGEEPEKKAYSYEEITKGCQKGPFDAAKACKTRTITTATKVSSSRASVIGSDGTTVTKTCLCDKDLCNGGNSLRAFLFPILIAFVISATILY